MTLMLRPPNNLQNSIKGLIRQSTLADCRPLGCLRHELRPNVACRRSLQKYCSSANELWRTPFFRVSRSLTWGIGAMKPYIIHIKAIFSIQAV